MENQTNYDHIANALKHLGKPLQRSDFRGYLFHEIEDHVLGVILHNMVRAKTLIPIKFPGKPSFYAHPDWVNKDGELIQEFDPIFKQWKKDQQNHGIKD
jgi:hypothetical protein